MKLQLWAVPLLLYCFSLPAFAQAADGTMSEAEIESLRDAKYIPLDRIAAFEKILDTREKRIDDLLSHRRHIGRELDLHDLMDQFAQITDEFTDNIDELRAKHRDIRKALPKLLQATDRWSTALKAPPADEAYNIVRKVALDNLKDLHDEAESLGPELDTYFREHPDAARQEKDRMDDRGAHAPKPQ